MALVCVATLGVALMSYAVGLWVNSLRAAPWFIAAAQTMVVGLFAERTLKRTWASALRDHNAMVSPTFSGGRYLWSHSRHAGKVPLRDASASPNGRFR